MTKKVENLHLDARIALVEAMKPVTRKSKKELQKEYEEATISGEAVDDIYSYITEADRVRLSYQILYKIEMKSLPKSEAALSKDAYSRMDDREHLIDFLKRHDIYKDI
jgi:hypothetical protein